MIGEIKFFFENLIFQKNKYIINPRLKATKKLNGVYIWQK